MKHGVGNILMIVVISFAVTYLYVRFSNVQVAG